MLDAGADGFYDVWGSFEGVGGQESGRLPDLPALLALTGGNVPDTRDRHSDNGGRQGAQRGEREGGPGSGEWLGGAGRGVHSSHFRSTCTYCAPFRSTQSYFVPHTTQINPWMYPVPKVLKLSSHVSDVSRRSSS